MSSTLKEKISRFSVTITDNSDVYAGDALLSGKGREKAQKGKRNLAPDCKDEPLVVVDSTVWGSVSEGFYITEKCIYAKSLFEDLQVFPIDSISSIVLEEEDRAVRINGVAIKWLGDATTPKIKIIFQCIEDHLLELQKVSAQKGKVAYIEGLISSIRDVQDDVSSMERRISSEVYDLLRENRNHTPFGDLSFMERTAISISRSETLKEYDRLLKQISTKVSSINDSVALKHANSILGDEGEDEFWVTFSPKFQPSRDTSLKNENWNDEYERAAENLMDASNSIWFQLQELIGKLKEIEE